MATNVTPQYHKAEAEYRRAATVEDELRWLEVMLREVPKHKASEKLQSELKQKISRAKKAVEQERKSPAKGHSVRIPRQGAGTALLIGGPNAGKSQLLAALTKATPHIAPYPFTTHMPQPGMMAWEDVAVQLIDTPPITVDFLEPYLQGMIRSADLVTLVIDLAADEGIEQARDVVARLQGTKTRLGATSCLDADDVGLSFTQTFLVPNKIDAPDAPLRLELLREARILNVPEYVTSATTGQGLDVLRPAIYKALDVIRVYTRLPRAKEPDYSRPFTLRRGSTVLEMAEMVHRDFVENFKNARVWTPGSHDACTVPGDHVLGDKDVVELHA